MKYLVKFVDEIEIEATDVEDAKVEAEELIGLPIEIIGVEEIG